VLPKKPVPVFIGDQFASDAIICTIAGFAFATISGIVVARPSEAVQIAKKVSNRIRPLRLIELLILTGATQRGEHRIERNRLAT
jgi:hypothetical protein